MSRPRWTEALPLLKGDLVTVREISRYDSSTLFELLSDPLVTKHMSPPPPTVRAVEGFIDWIQRERAQGTGFCFGIVPAGLDHAVGIIQVRALEPSFSTAEWGFAIGSAFWSTGVFVEAARLVAQYAFETVGIDRLEARAVVKNGRGNGVLQKMGATAEASLSRAFRRPTGYDTQFLWTLTSDDWRQLALVRAPFCASEAITNIACAIAASKDLLNAAKSNSPTDLPPLYPFFVTESPRKSRRS